MSKQLAELPETTHHGKESVNHFAEYQNQDADVLKDTATYVLVPGAGHPAASYDQVQKILEAQGRTVHAVTLPGVGERRGELSRETGLQTHIVDVVNFLRDQRLQDVVLVGHSYAGMVITGVADRVPERIRHLVYLDAVHPQPGQSLIEAQPLIKHVPAVSKPRVVDGVTVNLYPDGDTFTFLGLLEPRDVAWAQQHLTPHPWKTFIDRLHIENSEVLASIPRTDIYTHKTAEGLTMAGMITDEEKSRAWLIDAGHDLMLTEPDRTAEMLLAAAAHSRS
ncbi:alpha/beta fold hydrolase [Pseudarthrobacter sp. fls2-241-R2A-127]|uniref:alpha/beta hydrolase n=1 Tax=Pseudarthrobacter sp. fls2-241-R2A-127 TaxID=3040303 RepID=UPI0025573F0A|nr:alpha/beta fold hydrolase [Pseudarthrobacter sp. fls2-241-R2A-127]